MGTDGVRRRIGSVSVVDLENRLDLHGHAVMQLLHADGRPGVAASVTEDLDQ